jgi:hypothetical protein
MYIKMIILIIIIFLFTIASSGSSESVWAAKNTGFIKSNESIYFENYLVRSKIVNNTKTIISVHKDENLVEISEFFINDSKKYDSVQISLLGINKDSSWISISKLENKNVWHPFSKKLMNWGEKYTIDNYSIDIDTIGIDSANLTIYSKDTSTLDTFMKDELKKYGDLGILIRNINRTGFLELEFFSSRLQGIKNEILTDKDEYLPDETVHITLRTTSDYEQNIMGIFLESLPNTDILPDKFLITGFNGTRALRSQITRLPANSTVTITATIETHDYYDRRSITSVSKNVRIAPVISIVKHVTSEMENETAPVQLYVYNSGTSNKSIEVHDHIPEGFGGKELNWNIEVGPGKSTILTYYVKPEKPGLYVFPEAIALWDDQSSISNRAQMIMHMPYIEIIKKISYNKGRTDVLLYVNNTGDRPAQVKVFDRVPQSSSIVSGVTEWSGMLNGGGSASFIYALHGNIDTFPAADATYRDVSGVIRQTRSNTVGSMMMKSEENIDENGKISGSAATAGEILAFMTVSFATILGIITGMTFITYLMVRIRER